MTHRSVISMLALASVVGATAAQAAPAGLQQAGVANQKDSAAVAHTRHRIAIKATINAPDRLHVRVATARDAEQQRWIARNVDLGTLSLSDVAALEQAQAEIASKQAALERRGHESVADALRMQHLQDLQDWAILGHRHVTEPRA